MRTQTPQGVKDFLPDDARWKVQLEQSIRRSFAGWGYQEVLTPSFEFFDTVNLGDSSDEQTLKFLDRDGQLLALRPDATTPLARMAATRFRDTHRPLRLSYVTNVFRANQDEVGREREFFQAGVECIGVASPLADAEVIALAAELLRNVELDQFQISLGHVQFFNGLLSECPDTQTRQQIRRSFLNQDYVGLQGILQRSALPQWAKNILAQLPRSHGERSVLEQLKAEVQNQAALDALANTKEICDHLGVRGLQKCISLDFSMLKSLDYYTGMVFEGYAPHLGFSLCTGGRYDRLLGQFGPERPAVGFAVGLERLLWVLTAQGQQPPVEPPKLFVWPGHGSHALRLAAERRAAGDTVILDVQNLERDEVLAHAKTNGMSKVIFVVGDDVKCVDVEQGGGQPC